MGNLRRHHVDFIRISNGDQHVRIFSTSFFEDIRVWLACLGDTPTIQCVCQFTNQSGRLVYPRGHIVVFQSKIVGNVGAYLSRTAK